MDFEELIRRIDKFADYHCAVDTKRDLLLLSDMCWALGAEPKITLRKRGREMVAADIYGQMERLPPEFETAIYSNLEGLYEDSAPPKAAPEQEQHAG